MADLTPTEADVAQARRMPELHDFFEKRTVAELLMDLHWLSQYLVYRHHQQEVTWDTAFRKVEEDCALKIQMVRRKERLKE